MKLKIFINNDREEEVIIYARKKTELIERIEQLFYDEEPLMIGYKDREAVKLRQADVYCFTVENDKICAVCENDTLQLKSRLYN